MHELDIHGQTVGNVETKADEAITTVGDSSRSRGPCQRCIRFTSEGPGRTR